MTFPNPNHTLLEGSVSPTIDSLDRKEMAVGRRLLVGVGVFIPLVLWVLMVLWIAKHWTPDETIDLQLPREYMERETY